MKVRQLIEQLQVMDPSGEFEVKICGHVWDAAARAAQGADPMVDPVLLEVKPAEYPEKTRAVYLCGESTG